MRIYPNGQLKTHTNAEGVTVSYEYNKNQQLTKLTIPSVGDITQSDFNWLAPQKVTYPNGVTTDYEFDALMRIKQIHTQNVSTSTDIMNYGYAYDKVGNITRKTTEKGVSNYTYDKAYRLTGATHPTLTNETFSYDKVGNRLTTQASATPWTYNNADQLLTTPEATYQYTPNGHTQSVDYTDTALPDIAYSYDSRERLKRVLKTADGSEIQSNRYDYNNRRLVKTTASAATYFLYSPKGLESEYDNNGNLVQGYLFGANTYSTNPILTYKPNASNSLDYHYYHNDHLFTPQRLTDSTGVLSWSVDYSAFGKTTITTESITNNLRFPGQYYDADIKLAQNYFRDYSAELGRYIESDPIGLDGGINAFGYSLQSPLISYDSTGLFRACQTCKPMKPPEASPPTNCRGEWMKYTDSVSFMNNITPADKMAKARGLIQLFSNSFCWCTWLCLECEAPDSIGKIPKDRSPFDTSGKYVTYGIPFIAGGQAVDSPTNCACSPPGKQLPCDDCEEQAE